MTTEIATQKSIATVQTVNPPINLYYLRRHNNGTIFWHAPDGKIYGLDPAEAKPYEWLLVHNDDGKPVMALYTKPGVDAILEVSLAGANSVAATLLHAEDDTARRVYYCATDLGNTTILQGPAFKLRAQGFEDSPIEINANFYVMCVG